MSNDYPSLPQRERIALASQFVLSAPPGELAEVLNDVKLILNDDAAYSQIIQTVVPKYHEEQYSVVELDGYKTVVHSVAKLPLEGSSKYFDPRGGRSFELDLLTLTASSFEPLDLPEETVSYLSSFTHLLDAYLSNHFTEGSGAVFPVLKVVPAEVPAEAAPAPEAAVEAKKETTPVTKDHALETALVATAEEVAPLAMEVDKDLAESTTEEVAGSAEPAVEPEEGQKDVALETALVETAEEVQEVSKEVEAGLTESSAEGPDGSEEVAETDGGAKDSLTEAMVAPPTAEEKSSEQAPSATEVAPPLQTIPALETSQPKDSVGVKEGLFKLLLSGHRYSPSNFWSGRWISSYDINLQGETVKGKIEVVVHYYEQGNVQLHTISTPSFPLPSAGEGQAKKILDEVERLEKEAQEGVNERLEELGGGAFRSLRRALPVTRQKVDWDKISGYKLGGVLGNGQSRPEVEADL